MKASVDGTIPLTVKQPSFEHLSVGNGKLRQGNWLSGYEPAVHGRMLLIKVMRISIETGPPETGERNVNFCKSSKHSLAKERSLRITKFVIKSSCTIKAGPYVNLAQGFPIFFEWRHT
jgi:hypothetical protein